ncbi:MAG: GNAT family N-acetyltransferase [Acidimicrobiales bacterium]
MRVRLRPLRLDDKDAALAAHEAMLSDDFHFLTGWEAGGDWGRYVRSWDELSRSTTVGTDRVPGTLLMAEVHGTLVGRASVRFALNDWLAWHAGHIGYGVLAEHRRRGYAGEILQQALVVVRAHGVDRVLVTCLDANVASAAVIEGCGGVLERVVPASDDDDSFRRYWIE